MCTIGEAVLRGAGRAGEEGWQPVEKLLADRPAWHVVRSTRMALGRRQGFQQELMVPKSALPRSPGHPFCVALKKRNRDADPTWIRDGAAPRCGGETTHSAVSVLCSPSWRKRRLSGSGTWLARLSGAGAAPRRGSEAGGSAQALGGAKLRTTLAIAWRASAARCAAV